MKIWVNSNVLNISSRSQNAASPSKTPVVLLPSPVQVLVLLPIAGNFRGAKYSWFSWLEVWPRIFYPRMKRPCLPLPTIQAATTKILSTKCLNIAEPRIFCPPKITRYTVISSASPCVVTNQNKPSVTTVVSHGIESIVAVFIRSRTTVCHRAIGRSSQGRTGYSYGEMKQSV